MEKEIDITKLENELEDLLNPVLPSKDFIDKLRARLSMKNPVMVEFPNYLLPIILISTGLLFGLVIFWGLRRIYFLFISPKR